MTRKSMTIALCIMLLFSTLLAGMTGPGGYSFEQLAYAGRAGDTASQAEDPSGSSEVITAIAPQNTALLSESAGVNETEPDILPQLSATAESTKQCALPDPDPSSNMNVLPEHVESAAAADSKQVISPMATAEPKETTGPKEMTVPDEAIEPTDKPDPEETSDPEEGDDPEETAVPEVKLGPHEPFIAAPGGLLTLALPIQALLGNQRYDSNADLAGSFLPYRAGQKENDFDQAIVDVLPKARIVILNAQRENFPLATGILPWEGRVITDGRNTGFAVFEDMQVREDALPGAHTVLISLVWEGADGVERIQSHAVTIQVVKPENGPVKVSLGSHAPCEAAPGESLTLALPIHVVAGEKTYDSHADAGGNTVPYRAGLAEDHFDQAIAEVIQEARVRITGAQSEGFPADPNVLSAERRLIADGRNAGYAVFENVKIPEETPPGEYLIDLTLFWTDADGTAQSVLLTEAIRIREASNVTLGEWETPEGNVGGTITIAVPIRYTIGNLVFHTNQSADGRIIPYMDDESGAGGGPAAYDQSATGTLKELRVSLAAGQPKGLPLDLSKLSTDQALISDGENRGYAVFDNIPVYQTAQPGEYSMLLDVSWRDDAGALQSSQLIAPLTIHYGSSIIVFTWLDLRMAVLDPVGPDTVYLGWCIGETGVDDGWETGATVNNGAIYMTLDDLPDGTAGEAMTYRSGITIIGKDPRNGKQVRLIGNGNNSRFHLYDFSISNHHTFTMQDVYMDGNHTSNTGNGCIYATGGGSTDVILTNCTLSGAGILNLTNSAADTNGYNSNSVTLNGCDLTVSHSGEVLTIKTGRVNLYGDNRWTRKNSGSTGAMLGQIDGGHFNIHQGASLIASTDHYFVRNGGYKSYFSISGKIDMTANSSDPSCHGMTHGSESILDLQIKPTGHLKITHEATAAASGLASLYATKIELAEGGRLEVYTRAPNTACIKGTLVDIELPEFVIIENTNNGQPMFDLGLGRINIQASVINCWKTDGAKYVWNNSDLKPFDVAVTGGLVAAELLESGFSGVNSGAALPEKNAMLSAANGAFDVTSANGGIRRLVFTTGFSAAIEPNTVYLTNPYVAGSVPAGFQGTVEVREYRMADWTPYPVMGNGGKPLQTVFANVTSSIFKTGSDWNAAFMHPDNRVYVICSRTDLLLSNTVEAHVYLDFKEKLELRDVPSTLSFGSVPISTLYQLLDPPDGWGLTVFSSYATASWSLYASATPMTNGINTLNDTLVFVDPKTGRMTPLSSARLEVAAKAAGEPLGIKKISWDTGEGLLLQLAPLAGTAGDTYGSEITWTLELED